ncbi:hypothetical protein [Acidovorax sp. SUPP2539]|uniref:hypothetical protein n=1 Tax=Acidovorax sp. SUPP2539 TaxID=2920878 RepID=UPI0023DE210B|nr:hypothetical protein [Acidovorax sp. SUPP2539]GKS88681.1 hypothetical protein AVTE2539_04970 [Acidovorax sp. SUPP2539]
MMGTARSTTRCPCSGTAGHRTDSRFLNRSTASVLLALAGLFLGGTSGQADTAQTVPSASPVSSRVGLLDARRPDAPRLVLGQPQPEGEALHYLRLSPPMGQKPECCVQAGAAVQDGSILQYRGEDTVPADERDAKFQKAPEEGFVGLLLAKNALVSRTNAHRVVLQWPDRKARVRVDHCLSSEGMHVRVAESGAKGQWVLKAHYYLPLGADVAMASRLVSLVRPPKLPKAL